ncbi:hypothetical protein AWE51_15115 [Aquimarina aggregata]|uniref:Uncharacterized protein n=1 Tax=Aquimarina aggregata TaxID=1642818 RepID=A0A162Y3N2_9FLAO|nr:hypothetical protein [Aquimarina aggregata]KZS38909.1 hypothetical protein AWE51_15115 [Aquimarina aggregata]
MQTYYNDIPRNIKFENKSMDFSLITDHFLALSDHEASYLKVINIYNKILSFNWKAKDKWLLDIPIIPGKFHKQRYATKNECVAIIYEMDQERNIDDFERFLEVPVEEFTLDEMLVFKAEDEALLREEELPTEMPPISEPIKQQKQLSTQPKKNQKQSFVIGKQLGSKKSPSSPTPIDSKPMHANSKKTKPSDDTSFFQL